MSNKGAIKIQVFTKTEDDLSYIVKNASLVRITNRGQSRLWIDEDEVLEPKETFIEADDDGKGINHTYSLKFISNPTPPSVDMPVIYAGNRLHIREHNRQ